MKAALCESFGEPLTVADLPRPEPGPGELLIRVKGCGVCHSDLTWWTATGRTGGRRCRSSRGTR